MPGLIATLDFNARPELTERHRRQLAASTWRPEYLVESWQDFSGRIALGRADLGIFNRGKQPISSHDGRFRVCLQGEIFDRGKRLQSIKDHENPLTGEDHADLLLATYLAEGLAGVSKLNGSFFFTLWDNETGTLTVGGDRYATRPHFYSFREGLFLLAPDVRGVLAGLDERPSIDYGAIAEFLAIEYPLDDHTYFEGVRQFPPGTFLRVTPQGPEWQQYWAPHYTGPDEAEPRAAELWLEEATHLYRQAVERTMEGHFCLPLSGGTDSRSILAFADRHDFPIFTFGDEGSDDVRFARLAAAAVDMQHHFIALQPDYMSRFADDMMTWGEGMVSLFHSHDRDGLDEVRGLAPVILAGMTAEYMRLEFADNVLAEHPHGLGGKLSMMLRHAREGRRPQVRPSSRSELFERMVGYVWTILTPGSVSELLSPDFAQTFVEAVPTSLAAAFDAFNPPAPEDHLMSYNVRQRQQRFTQYGMKISSGMLEVRKPLDDYDLVDFMLRTPPATRRKLQTQVLCHAHPTLASVPRTGSGVPLNAPFATRAIAYAKKEIKHTLKPGRVQSFADPQSALRLQARPFYESILLDPGTLHNGLYNAAGVERLVRRHMAGEVDAASVLCALATIELWRREHASGQRGGNLWPQAV